MIHWEARRLLADLVDGSLSEPVEAELRGHTQGCAPCRRLLRELEVTQDLLRRLPLSLTPATPSPEAEARLAALARWAADPEPVWRERFGVSAVGALAAAAALAILLTTASWAPVVRDPAEAATLAAVMPEATHHAPLGWR